MQPALALGELYGKLGKYKQALPYLESASQAQPTYSDLHYQLGLAYEKTGKKAKAAQQYREALRYIPDMPDALTGLKRVSR